MLWMQTGGSSSVVARAAQCVGLAAAGTATARAESPGLSAVPVRCRLRMCLDMRAICRDPAGASGQLQREFCPAEVAHRGYGERANGWRFPFDRLSPSVVVRRQS